MSRRELEIIDEVDPVNVVDDNRGLISLVHN